MTRSINHQTKTIKLELLGIGSLRYQSVKQNLEMALQQLELNIPIVETKDIESILECDIIGIPALKINDTIISQEHVPSTQDLKDSISSFLAGGSLLILPKQV